MSEDILLELQNINKSFSGVPALSNVSLNLHQGEILALLGENGAGKSTLMKVLSGAYQADSGIMKLRGNIFQAMDPRHAQQLGIGIIYQEFSLIPDLKVYENIFLGREEKTGGGFLDRRSMRKKAEDHLHHLGVQINTDLTVRELSVAQQQFVEIAKALSHKVSILVLDEPTATLTPNETKQLFSIMRELKKQHVGMIFISHHLEEIFEIADNVMVLRDGQYIGTNPVKDITVDDLVKMMVGRDVSYAYPTKKKDESKAEVVLNVKRLQRFAHSPELKFHLNRGEILGIAGLVGAGRSEILLSMIGADHAVHREIELNGQTITIKSPVDALENGIGLLPESRKTQGLVTPFSVAANTVINTLKKRRSNTGFIKTSLVNEVTWTQIKAMSIKTTGPDQPVCNLSGGNQQKVVIGKWLSTQCQILIFDEPTRGIDVGAKAEIYELMHKLTERGMSIIMISSELTEVVGMSDRVLVVRDDAIVKELEGNDIHPETIMKYAAGGVK